MTTITFNSNTFSTLRATGWFITFLFTLAGLAYLNGYRINTSYSYPPGLYQLEVHAGDYQTGELVLFCPPKNKMVTAAISRGYLDKGRCESGSVPIIKRIAAMEKDTVSLGTLISINGTSLPSTTIMQEDGEHRPLTPFTLKGLRQFTLPPDTAFVYSDYAPSASFDSRYFGWVAMKDIQGSIKPIWTTATH